MFAGCAFARAGVDYSKGCDNVSLRCGWSQDETDFRFRIVDAVRKHANANLSSVKATTLLKLSKKKDKDSHSEGLKLLRM